MFLQIFRLSLIGGLINLDDVPVMQTMISQPIIAAPLIGWIWGDFQSGLLIGAYMELLMICFLPIGCEVPADSSLASVTAISLYLLAKAFFPGSLRSLTAMVILLSFPLSLLARKTSILVRKINNKISDYAQQSVRAGKAQKINILHFMGIILFFLRSFSFCFFTLSLLVFSLKKVTFFFNPGVIRGLELLYLTYPLIGIAIIFHTFRDRSMYFPFIISFLSASLLASVWSLPPFMCFGIPTLVWSTVFGFKDIFVRRSKV